MTNHRLHFRRIEFVSNPQGDANEWRPGYIESSDAGGCTGGLRFVVNGTGAGSKFGEVETMRMQNGRVGIGNNAPSMLLQVGNATCNGTIWNNASDRNLKEHLKPVDAQAILEKVAALPLNEWNYKAATNTRHIGPMAQDFKAAFGLGTDERHIATVDADGVALAAIQGLNQKVEAQQASLEQKETEFVVLKQRLDKIERLFSSQDPEEN